MCGSTAAPEDIGETLRGQKVYRCRTCTFRELLYNFRPDPFG